VRIAVAVFDYRVENISLLPWRYVHEVSKQFIKLGNEVIVLTDGYPQLPKTDYVDGVQVVRLRHIKHFPPCHFDEVLKIIDKASPDVIFWLMGLTSFFQKKLYTRLRSPIVALISSPVYSRYELLRDLSIDTVQNNNILLTNFAETFVPKYFIRDTLNHYAIKLIITMSERNKQRLEKIGVKSDKLVCIPPGQDLSFLPCPSMADVEKARAEICSGYGNCFLATYFGPPLKVRGVDTLLYAFRFMLKKFRTQSRFRVLILSRELSKEHKFNGGRLLDLVHRLGLQGIVEIKHGFLSRDKIKAYLAASDLLVLPFKHVISEIPISIIEGMALGVPVLSTDVDGIPELLSDGRGIIVQPGDYRSLAETIAHYSGNMDKLKECGKEAREYMLSYPTWNNCAQNILKLLKS
jgi:phosphatidylinositol alpha-1,6-mannosyltransferase